MAGEIDPLAVDVLAARGGRADKRPRVETEESQPEEPTQTQGRTASPEAEGNPRPTKPMKRRVVGRQKKPLKPITAMLADRPVDILSMLQKANVVLPITHLA